MRGDIFDFSGIDGFYFPPPVVNRACDRKIIGVGAVKFRIDSGASGNNHTCRLSFILNDGVGDQRGAQDNAVNFFGVMVPCYRR